jgi:hypothetical protein
MSVETNEGQIANYTPTSFSRIRSESQPSAHLPHVQPALILEAVVMGIEGTSLTFFFLATLGLPPTWTCIFSFSSSTATMGVTSARGKTPTEWVARAMRVDRRGGIITGKV